ncbi:Hypothetical protein ACGLYG10_1270 [Actinomyces glycerinitolerans]|uniref:ABC transmembrane type-1 domain-containing protein n=2 Tax=Actinomyces glycerinitolerans TaxID=1892869 RepID=A0A1M4RYM3_9ACTO|nr:Hypothetical protein ACGLYG10_1270 [Actinomyces glycerinitolerans]
MALGRAMASETNLERTHKKRRWGRSPGTYHWQPFVFVAVIIILYLVFFVWPAASGLFYSFTNYKGRGSFSAVGLSNYAKLLSDKDFYSALLRTFEYTVIAVPLGYVLSLFSAVILTSKRVVGAAPARMLLFMPWLISPIVVGVIWRWMFGESFGLINYLLSLVGLGQPSWQTSSNLSLAVVIFAGAWAGTAFNMLLFIGALKNVSTSVKEAAALDGASSWQTFWHIILPSIRPTSFMVILLSTLGSMKEFALVQAVNGGGPGTSNNFIVQYIYTTGFSRAKVGYASAASMVLMVILLILSLVQLRLNRDNEA